MKRNSVAYTNLRVEMARENLAIGTMAHDLGMNRDTLSRKLARKSPLNLDEAFAIQKKYFPDQTVSHLFSGAR